MQIFSRSGSGEMHFRYVGGEKKEDWIRRLTGALETLFASRKENNVGNLDSLSSEDIFVKEVRK